MSDEDDNSKINNNNNNNHNNFDAPACDGCGKDFGGRLACSRCGAAYYCGKSCQKIAWRKDHKKICNPDLPNRYHDMAVEVIETLEALSCLSSTSNRAVPVVVLERLDKAGPYRAARDKGIMGIIQQLFELEAQTLSQRWNGHGLDMQFCNTQLIGSTFFRGERTRTDYTYGVIDAGRIIDYVLHDYPKALEAWLDATVAVLKLPYEMVDNNVRYRHDVLSRANLAARDVTRQWTMIFTNPCASKVILLGSFDDDKNDVDRDAVLAHANSVVDRFIRAVLTKMYAVSREDDDRNSNVEGLFHTVVAMVQQRLKEYQVHVDFFDTTMLEMEHMPMAQHRGMAVPVAAATIRKGRALTSQETHFAMTPAANTW